MGLHASSTEPVILSDARVPAENVLGEIGRGHKVAFNVLNYGRLKLGAATAGGARAALGEAVAYAAQRRQFRLERIDPSLEALDVAGRDGCLRYPFGDPVRGIGEAGPEGEEVALQLFEDGFQGSFPVGI